jgi:type VI secretion system protein ImpL
MMKESVLRFLKIFLVIVGILFIVLLVFGIVLSVDWPWWVGIFLLLGLVGVGIAFLFFRKLWRRRREQLFVQQVIEQDESSLKNLTGKERDDLKELQDRWKEAVETLRRSHLRKHGNPLYVLPWYLVIGESGSGKTTAIHSARLSSTFAEVARTSGISGTRNCDWWFFEQAIIIDTAGRYAIPVDEGRDKEEWRKFLGLLIKYRRKEPIHGLIVAISADRVLQATPETLQDEGRGIRRRIDELMRVLGAKFPVYVLVTKCDLIQGMTQFSDQLPEKSLDQPMGFINTDFSSDGVAFEEKAFVTIGERLRNLRILLLHQSESKTIDPGLLLFPEAFEDLRGGLGYFMKEVFLANPYQETPILRGLFFSSGRQEGSPYSHFLNALGLIAEKEVLPGTSKGLFLHDFFAKILPKDRGLFAPTKRAVQWQILTRNLGLTSWVILGVAMCGLLSFSFVKNLKAIREASHEFSKPMLLQGDVLYDLDTMDRFCQAVLRVEAQNRNWWVPRFGLTESIEVEVGLKRRYCRQFQDGFLSSFDKSMSATLTKLTSSSPDEVIGRHAAHLARRINLLKTRLGDQGLEGLRKKPQPPFSFSSATTTAPPLVTDTKKKFGNLYLYYLLWRLEPGETTKEMEVLQSWLKHLVFLKGSHLPWLTAWANRESGLSSITLRDFWGGSGTGASEQGIAYAFTRKGKGEIDSFIQEIESALPDPSFLAGRKPEFEKWYCAVCLAAWQNFALLFPRGVDSLRGAKEWQQMAGKMATEQGPYFAFFNRMAFELEPLTRGGGLSPWVQEAYQFQVIKAESLLKEKGALGKAAEEGKRLLATLEKTIGKDVGGATLESQVLAARAYQEYYTSLTAITAACASRNLAYQIAAQTYNEDPATSKSPFFTAYGAATRLKTTLTKGKPTEEVFSKLLMGPLEFLWTFVRMETACYLQGHWEEKVLSEAQGATGQHATQLLLGAEGLAWKFLKGPAAPFVGRSLQRGYYPKEILGGLIPFEASFFTFLVKGSQIQTAVAAKENYGVLIKALPTDANPDARLKPHSTRLDLQCSGGAQSLVNFHYPVSKTFNWSPETCREVSFQIEVGDIFLVTKYTGEYAFAEFLRDFRGGQHTFYPNDFPRERPALERLGIKYIRANYQFVGDQPILALLVRSSPGQPPRKIVTCWGQ